MVSDNQYRISVAETALNKIEVRSENVESMRFYLNEQFIEFSRPNHSDRKWQGEV